MRMLSPSHQDAQLTSMLTSMQHLEPAETEMIRALKASYFRLVDTKQWPRLRRTFTEEASFEGFSTSAPDPDTFVANLENRLADVVTVHQGHGLEPPRLRRRRARCVCHE